MSESLHPTWAQFWAALPSLYLEPIATAMAAGAVLGFLGVYVIVRRMVFISAALSAVSGAGVALAFFLSLFLGEVAVLTDPVALALILSLAATLFLRLDPSRVGATRDGLLGLTYVTASAATLLLGTRITQEAHDIKSILFGSAVVVTSQDLWLTVGVGLAVVLLHITLLRGLAAATFDSVATRVQGLPVGLLESFLFATIAVTVAVTTRALGALPVFGFTVLPALAALALTRHISTALFVAAFVGASAGAAGYVYSFFLRLPVGASQAIVAGVVAAAAMGARLAANRNVRRRQRVPAGLAALTVVILALMPFFTDLGAPLPFARDEHGHLDATTAQEAAGLTDLLAQLGSTDPEQRAHAAHQLGKGHEAAARSALIAALADPEWNVRAEAAEALSGLGGEPPRELLALLEEDESPWVREAAAHSLTHFRSSARAREALARAAAEDPESSVRAAARRRMLD